MTSSGRVKWFDAGKGYGFINTDGGGEVFVHITGIKATAKSLRVLSPGDEVEFQLANTERGERAQEVKVVRHVDAMEAAQFVNRQDERSQLW